MLLQTETEERTLVSWRRWEASSLHH